jgi:solute:Na+ symporter, SSS family
MKTKIIEKFAGGKVEMIEAATAKFDSISSVLDGLPSWFATFLALNGMQASVVVLILSSILYVTISLITCSKLYNMDKLLHRGKYAIGHDHDAAVTKEVPKFLRFFGITKEFTMFDKVIYFSQLAWVLIWLMVFIVGMTINYGYWQDAQLGKLSSEFIMDWERSWADWWGVQMGIFGVMALIFTVWFCIGGVRDLLRMFKALNEVEVDEADDGMVVSQPEE